MMFRRIGLACATLLAWASFISPGWAASGPKWTLPMADLLGLQAALTVSGQRSIAVTGLAEPAMWQDLAAWARQHGQTPLQAEQVLLARPLALPVVKLGGQGKVVELLKRRLAALGVAGLTGSTYDAAAEQAVRTFQTARSLPADGVVGPLTWRALFSVPYTAFPRETLASVARTTGLALTQLVRWNLRLANRQLSAGEIVNLVPPPLVPSRATLEVVSGSERLGLVIVGLPSPSGRLPAVLRALGVHAAIAVNASAIANAGTAAVLALLQRDGDEVIPAEPAQGMPSVQLTRWTSQWARRLGELPVVVWAGPRPSRAAARSALAAQAGVVVGAFPWPTAKPTAGEIAALPGRDVTAIVRAVATLRQNHLVPSTLSNLLGP